MTPPRSRTRGTTRWAVRSGLASWRSNLGLATAEEKSPADPGRCPVRRLDGRPWAPTWLRLADHRPPDPWSLLVVVDALPPVSLDLGLPGWAPTVELTVHVRQRPVDGWLRVRHATRTVAGGSFEEDCEVWDEAGHLAARSRQLALLPRASKLPS